MVREGIVLRHLVSERGIEVDRAKIEAIEQLPPPINIRGICSFLGHAGFYRCFIKVFSHIARPLINILAKDVPFNFDDACLKSFEILKKALIPTPIIQPLIGRYPQRFYQSARKIRTRSHPWTHAIGSPHILTASSVRTFTYRGSA